MEKETYFAWYRLRGLGLVCLCSLVFFFGAYLANQKSVAVSGSAGARPEAVARVRTEEKKAALSFDVTEPGGSVQVILNILEKYGAKASFFVTPGWVAAYPEELKKIAASGHDVGSRGLDRGSMAGRPRQEVLDELQTLHSRVQELAGLQMRLFRAPYGDYDSALIGTAASAGYVPVLWSIDSEDWKGYGVESVLKKVTDSSALAGAIIRLHAGAPDAVHALEQMIAGLQGQGYELVTVSQLLG